jgi:hypothetical protein
MRKRLAIGDVAGSGTLTAEQTTIKEENVGSFTDLFDPATYWQKHDRQALVLRQSSFQSTRRVAHRHPRPGHHVISGEPSMTTLCIKMNGARLTGQVTIFTYNVF